MELKFYPDPILRQKANPVEDITEEIIQISKDMMWIMRASGGIGIAAQQVGVLHRIICIDTTSSDVVNGFKAILINPVLLSCSSTESLDIEGCLSFPGEQKLINRPFAVKVRYVDENKKVQTHVFSGLTARCFLHEFDHLDGKLFIDYEAIK